MAYESAAELLTGFDFWSMRSDTDESISDATKYILLEQAQKHVYGVFAVHVPEVLYGAPAKLTTADSGLTYTFPNSDFPSGNVEIRASRNGALLIPTTDWGDGDYVWEGNLIRTPNGKTRTYADGPYARYVVPAGTLDASNAPTLSPAKARILILYYALYMWAERGAGMNQVDPNRYLGLYQSELSGDQRIPGDIGILGELKRQGYGSGATALDIAGPWHRSTDLG